MARIKERNRSFRNTLGYTLALASPRPVSVVEAVRLATLAVEDRRFWTPATRPRSAGALSRVSRGLVVGGSMSRPLSSRVGFADPKRVSVCVRRKIRKEVILAKGKGGSRHRRPRRNYWSDVDC